MRAAEGDDPASWAQPSTLVAAAVAAALRGRSLSALGVDDLHAALGDARAGVAIFAVVGSGDADAVRELNVRIWPAGEPLDGAAIALAASEAGVGAAIEPVAVQPPEAIPPIYWVSFTLGSDAATVFSVPVLVGRLATLVAQVDHDRLRVFQYHPEIKADGTISKDMGEIELLERMLLAGRLDVAAPLAAGVADRDSADLFARVVAGYVLLRLGRHEELGELASQIVTAAPTLSDGYILRAELEANSGRLEQSAQAFADAVNAGMPAFAEGLTRLVEGLRANPAVTHPRAAIVRHVFQRHARGSMWAAFRPRRKPAPGSPVISAADVGLEA